jgi:hypothetical protein
MVGEKFEVGKKFIKNAYPRANSKSQFWDYRATQTGD